jgi:hypothetical protein
MELVTDRGKLSSANRSRTEDDRKSRGLATPRLPQDSVSRKLVSGSLAFIFVTIAILIHDDMRQDKEPTRELDGGEIKLEQMQPPFVSLQSYPFVVNHVFPTFSPQKSSWPPPWIAVPSPSTALASNAKINRAVESTEERSKP